MEFGAFGAEPNFVRLLVIADVDIASASLITEQFVPQAPHFDAVLLCGPFCHEEPSTGEEHAVAMSEIGSIIAQLENIVCRVIYLGSAKDPTSSIEGQLHLTPNSVNIHNRLLPLAKNLFALGFAETSENLSSSGLPADNDRSAESDDELEGVEVQSGSSSVTSIEGLLKASVTARLGAASEHNAPTDPTRDKKKCGLGMFVLNYKFMHTLNHVLFHMPEELEAAGIKVCILPPALNTVEPVRLPKTFGSLSIAALGSLRVNGQYTVIELSRANQVWTPQAVDRYTLDAHLSPPS